MALAHSHSAPNPNLDFYFTKASRWQNEFQVLRAIALRCGLTEELKWGHPCYTLTGKHVVLMHGFKEYCALLFHKGALLENNHGLLIQQTKNVQAARQIRFTSLAELTKQERIITRTIKQAIAIEKSGQKVQHKATAEFDVPAEFTARLKDSPALKKAFSALTPGRQRGYLLHFGSAKQSATREARIEKNTARILSGKGLDD
jgi:uncharacterized protein YdeI (YjbR/CyaY-like superfamily)